MRTATKFPMDLVAVKCLDCIEPFVLFEPHIALKMGRLCLWTDLTLVDQLGHIRPGLRGLLVVVVVPREHPVAPDR